MHKLIEIEGMHPLAGPPPNGFYSITDRNTQSDGLRMVAGIDWMFSG
jgi:hypothetical protein